jgi:hypothetical protein
MRIGVIGQAGNAKRELRKAIELLLADPEVRQVIYLGMDGSIEEVVGELAEQILSADDFFARAVDVACQGDAAAISDLLAQHNSVQRLSAIRKLPEPPARAIEMLEKWIVLGVHDKAILDEDDVANAHVIVYGKANDADFKRFGPRAFLTPGPLAKGKVGLLSLLPEGGLELALMDLDGQTLRKEEISAAAGKVVVTS